MRNVKITVERNMGKNDKVLCIKGQARWQDSRNTENSRIWPQKEQEVHYLRNSTDK